MLRAITEASGALKRTTGGVEGITEAEQTMDEMAELIDDSNAVSVIYVRTYLLFGRIGIAFKAGQSSITCFI